MLPDAIIANASGVAMQNNLPKISSATAQPASDQEAGIYIRVYNNITSDNITYYNLVDNTYNTAVPGFSGAYWVKYAVKWLAATNEFEIQQIPGKAEDFNGSGMQMIKFLNDYVYGKENMYAIISQKDRLEFGSTDYTKNYFKAGVKLKWQQESGLAPNQLATDMVYPEGANKVIVRVPQPANFTYAKVIGSYGESPTGIPVEPLYRIYPEFPTDNGDYILKLNHSIAEVGGGEKLTWENYTPSSGFNPVETVTDDGQILIGYRDGRYTWATQTVQELQETADGASRMANEVKTDVGDLQTRVTTLEQNVATKSTFILLSDLYPDASQADGTYADYPYRFDYAVTGLTVNDVVEVILNLPAATSGNIAPITRSDAGKFSIYCKTDSSISDTISAIVFKGGN